MLQIYGFTVISEGNTLKVYQKSTLSHSVVFQSLISSLFEFQGQLYVQHGQSVSVYDQSFRQVQSFTTEGSLLTDGSQLIRHCGDRLIMNNQKIQLDQDYAVVVAQNGYALAYDGCQISVINLSSTHTVRVQHVREITVAVCHPSKDIVAIGDVRGQITLLEFKSFESGHYKTRKLHWHPYSLKALVFSLDGNYLYSGGQECVLVRWHLESKTKSFLPRTKAPVEKLVQLSDGNLMVSLNDNSYNILTPVDWSIVQQISGVAYVKTRKVWNHLPLNGCRGSLAVDVKAQAAVLTSVPGSLQFWSMQHNCHMYELQVCPPPRLHRSDEGLIQIATVAKCSFSPCGYQMATVDELLTEDGELISHLVMWKRTDVSWVKVTSFTNPHEGAIVSLEFAQVNGSSILATCCSDGQFKTWQLQQRQQRLMPTLMQNTGNVELWVCMASGSYRGMKSQVLSFSADGSVLAIALGKVVTFWNPITLELCGTIVLPMEHAQLMSFDQLKRLMIASDTEVLQYDMLTRQIIWREDIACQCLTFQAGQFLFASSDVIYQLDPDSLELKQRQVADLVGLVSDTVYLNESFSLVGVKSKQQAVVSEQTNSMLKGYLIEEDVIEQERQSFKAQRKANFNHSQKSSHQLPDLQQMLKLTVDQLMPRKPQPVVQ